MRITILLLAFSILFHSATAQLSIPSKKWGIGYGYHEPLFSGILFHTISPAAKRSNIIGLNIGLITGHAHVRGVSYATIKNSFMGDGISLSGVLLNGYICRGFMLTGVMTDISSLIGISISPINKIENCNGVAIGLVNITHRKRNVGRYYFEFPRVNKGVQIGLLNHQKGFRGIQIGLININKGKRFLRILPFINIDLRRFSV